MLNRENNLKQRLRELQEQRGDIEDDLLTTRAELESARNSGSNQDAIVKTPKIRLEVQAEIDRLTEALELNKAEVLKLRRANEDLSREHDDNTSHMKVRVPLLTSLFLTCSP